MENNVNKVLDGIGHVLVCDSTLEGCEDCPYTLECVPSEMINVPRKLLQDANKVLAQYKETLQPGYKTAAEIELECIVNDYKARLNRFAYKTYVSVGTNSSVICSVCDNKLDNNTYTYCPHCGGKFV